MDDAKPVSQTVTPAPASVPIALAGSAAATPGDDFALSLAEFCTRLSSTDTRVELIAAFHHVETVGGRIKDAAENYSARYAAFLSQPV